MNGVTRSLGAALSLAFAAGCARNEPPPPKRDDVAMQREWLYGKSAEAPGIEWRPSGLGVRSIAAGEGASPGLSDMVRVHYVLRLKDGRVIEDTRARGEPRDFLVSRLIPGWAGGMTALKPGGRAELFVPPSLGYGNASGGGIPGRSGLIFDIELLAVNPVTIPAIPGDARPK
ncbi:MAG: FKBP-type peptidyl-prolyl cis-trans isomerase [Opitutaceae bacterium]